jgi:hypothetical protein
MSDFIFLKHLEALNMELVHVLKYHPTVKAKGSHF